MAKEQSVDEKAEALAIIAADRAAKLALNSADRATALAVERAVKDTNIARDIRDHDRHLARINGSQTEMAESLKQLLTKFDKQLAVQEAISTAIENNDDQRFSRRARLIATVAALGAYVSVIAVILTQFH